MSDLNIKGVTGSIDPSLYATTAKDEKKTAQMGQEEFLNLLVIQLKNQDPLDPMTNEDFAVQLAQFSQLEQLIEINNNLGGGSGSSMSSLAGYLGNEVRLNSSVVQMTAGSGGNVNFNLPAAATNVQIDLLDSTGARVETVTAGAREAGENSVSLTNTGLSDGEYTLSVTAKLADGSNYKPEYSLGGTVTGFIPGENPLLIVDGREVSPLDIAEVRIPSSSKV